MKLSENFTLEELTDSLTAKKLGLSNVPNQEQIDNLSMLVKNTLQPIRNALGKPIKVTSGYRSPDLNKSVGGTSKSQHNEGKAADIVVSGLTPYEVCQVVISLGIDFDQLICEPTWSHVSYNKGNNRKQVLTMKKESGKTVYLNGLID